MELISKIKMAEYIAKNRDGEPFTAAEVLEMLDKQPIAGYDNVTLNPCPLCDGAAEIRTGKTDGTPSYPTAYVRCLACDCTTRMYVDREKNGGAVFKAIDAWNRRAATRINLNEKVKFKLTEYGKDIYYHRHDDVKGVTPRYPKQDEDGYTTMQLWDFMELYGKYFYMGQVKSVIEPLEIIYEGDSV